MMYAESIEQVDENEVNEWFQIEEIAPIAEPVRTCGPLHMTSTASSTEGAPPPRRHRPAT